MILLEAHSWMQDLNSHRQAYPNAASRGPPMNPDTETNAVSGGDPLGPDGQHGTEPLACVSCRARKLKCDRTRPVCSRCLKVENECVYPESRRKPTFKRKNVKELEARLGMFPAKDYSFCEYLLTPRICNAQRKWKTI